MSGRIDLFPFVLLPITLIASITDILYSKIFNWLTLSTAFAGLLWSTYSGGWLGLGNGITGVIAGFLLFGWIFALGQMGGGDVKYLMALGAWGGPLYTFDVAFLSVLLGGILSLGRLAAAGQFLSFLRKLQSYVLALWISWTTQTVAEWPKTDQSLQIPFAIPISIAAIWVYFFHPLNQSGLLR